MKLQQAYISEAVAVGNWSIIGYKGPGTPDASAPKLKSATTNFTYSDGGSYTNNTAALGDNAVKGWSAQNNTKLNDCDSAADNWKVEVKAATATGSSQGDAAFTSTVASACTDLTPQFGSIGK